MSPQLSSSASRPMPWKGRYGRVMGDRAVFHLRHTDGRLWPVIDWETAAGVATCRAIDCPAIVELVAAVARAKTTCWWRWWRVVFDQ